MRAIHSLPHRRGGIVLGLVNVRGVLRACVSLARVLGLDDEPDAGAADTRRLLVARERGEPVAFPVDEVHGTHRYAPHELQPRPATVALAAASFTRAVLPWRGGFVGLLDEQALFHTIDRSLASPTT